MCPRMDPIDTETPPTHKVGMGSYWDGVGTAVSVLQWIKVPRKPSGLSTYTGSCTEGQSGLRDRLGGLQLPLWFPLIVLCESSPPNCSVWLSKALPENQKTSLIINKAILSIIGVCRQGLKASWIIPWASATPLPHVIPTVLQSLRCHQDRITGPLLKGEWPGICSLLWVATHNFGTTVLNQ